LFFFQACKGVELDKAGDDKHLAISVAQHLGTEKSITRFGAALSALDGEEYKKKCEITASADDRLQKTLRAFLI